MQTLILQAIISGMLLGLIYGLIGMGMNIIYGVMRVVNFAHGEFMIIGSYMAFWIGRVFGLNVLESLIIILPIFFLFGLFIYYLTVPRLLRSEDPEIASFLTFFGVSLIITSVVLLLWGADPRSVSFPFKRVSFTLGSQFIPMGRIISGGFCAATIVLLSIFLFKTYTGQAIRAIIQNREAVSILGIDPHKISSIAFGIGLFLVGMAGGLVTLSFPAITPVMGQSYTLIAFVVIVLGGLGSPIGALLGGLLFGLAENLGAIFMPTALAPVIAFVLLIVMILIRPQGIMGKAIVGI